MPMQKVIFHLEAFVAKFMRIYERLVSKLKALDHANHYLVI